jgi:membrane-associated phospholipid phosphatase
MRALTVPFSLVALGDHTPTDVVGSLFLAACLFAVWHPRLAVELGTASHSAESTPAVERRLDR